MELPRILGDRMEGWAVDSYDAMKGSVRAVEVMFDLQNRGRRKPGKKGRGRAARLQVVVMLTVR